MESSENVNAHSDEYRSSDVDGVNMTNLQDSDATLSENLTGKDNLTDLNSENTDNEQYKTETEPSPEEKYASLNDSYLRLMAEFDNYRKRTIREKADLIRNGGESVLRNILPVVDDFDRALETLKKTSDLQPAVEGVQLIYDKFIGCLLQQGVKKMDTLGMSFDVEMYEAIATIPVPDENKKGKVIDCVQAGYMMYDKVLRHAKVVVGE